MKDELQKLSALQIAHAVNSGQVSAAEVTSFFCERVARLNPELNAFANFDPEEPILAAQSVDDRLRGNAQLPLAGVPFTVKDNLWLEGRPATFGSKLFQNFIAPRDSWAVAKLRELGAVPLGVTTSSEFACKGITASPLYGETRNPWDPDKTPGGSSGGGVASVSAGLAPLALATDAGGSVRRPSAHTGLVGMKPTLGRVPNPWGFDDPNHLLSVVGQIGRNVEDVAFMLDALTAWDPRDTLSCPSFATPDVMRTLKVPLKKPRLAWSPHLGCGLHVDSDVLAALEASVDALSQNGWEIIPSDPKWPAQANEYPLIALQQAALAQRFGEVWKKTPTLLDPDIGAQIELGFSISGTRITELLKLREEFHTSFTNFYADFDALLCPVSPVEAWSLGSLGPTQIGGLPAGPRGHAAFTPIFNYGGVPAISIPCGVGRQGLPVGLQIAGPRFADALVMQLAWHAEQVLGVFPFSPFINK
jgi:aspartyl-tRNA(Asn)/glutamyl-tRNA(Gln) amidotransferase subunit A